MVEQKSQKVEEDPLDTRAVAVKAFNKKVTEHVGNVVDQAVSSPEETDFRGLLNNLLKAYPENSNKSPQSSEDIIKQILDVAARPVETGEKMGLIPSLLKTGKFGRQPATEPLGINDAIKVIQLQNESEKTSREIPKEQLDYLREVQQILLSTPEGAAEFEKAKLKATESFKEQEKERVFKEDIDSFIQGFEVAEQELIEVMGPEVLETGPGGKIKRGIGSIAKSLDMLPKSSAFVSNLLVSANKMARTVEGGRVTDADREVYADALANSLANPSSENTELIVTSLRNMKNKGGDISRQTSALLRSKSKTLSAAGLELSSNQEIIARRLELINKSRRVE